MKKKLFAVTLILTLMMGITCFANSASGPLYGGYVNCDLSSSGSKGTGKTKYSLAGYSQYVAVFGYDKSGVAIVSASDDRESRYGEASATTNKNSNVKNYKGIHYIKDLNGNTLAKYTTEA